MSFSAAFLLPSNTAFLVRKAAEHGEAIARFAQGLLDAPLPWTRLRRVYAILGYVRRYGAEHLEQACATALAVDMVDVHRLERMLKLATTPRDDRRPPTRSSTSAATYLRPATDYTLPLPCVREAIDEGADE